tara:strand:- start:735 stop:1043 length:309 start_codon:yes stop_codon:yes gene_type:complete
MKTEAVKTVFNSDDFGLEDHSLTIDKISELDPEGNVVLVKLIAYVIDPIGNAMVFNYSPYAKLGELLESAKVWIQCGCPSDCDATGFPRKWDRDSLHAWAAS